MEFNTSDNIQQPEDGIKDPFKEGTLDQHKKDKDVSWDSLHHTLGKGPTQAASGNHKHVYEDISGVPTETLPHDHASVPYATNAGSAANATNASEAAHSARTGRGNINLNWMDDGTQRFYVFMGNSPEDQSVFPAGSLSVNYANSAGSAGSAGNADTVDGYHEWSLSKVGHGHNPSDSGITSQLHGPFSVNAASEHTIGPIGKNSDEHVFYSLFHPSAYIFLSMPSLNPWDFTIKIRNSTTSTNHTGIYVLTLRVRAA